MTLFRRAYRFQVSRQRRWFPLATAPENAPGMSETLTGSTGGTSTRSRLSRNEFRDLVDACLKGFRPVVRGETVKLSSFGRLRCAPRRAHGTHPRREEVPINPRRVLCFAQAMC